MLAKLNGKPTEIKGAIFDQDGLLFDTEILFERAWREAGRKFGVEVSDELTHACCGCGRNELPAVIRMKVLIGLTAITMQIKNI